MEKALIHKTSPLLSPVRACPDNHKDQISAVGKQLQGGHMAEDGKLKFLIDTKLLGGNLAQIRNYIWEEAGSSASDRAVWGTVAWRDLQQQAHSWFNS